MADLLINISQISIWFQA